MRAHTNAMPQEKATVLTPLCSVGVCAVACALVFAAPEKESASLPEPDTQVTAAVDPNDVDQALLRKKVGTKNVKWDRKTGILTLVYDFRRIEEKDWEIARRPQPSQLLKGIRLAAGETLVHKVLFKEATIECQYAFRNAQDSGIIVSAGAANNAMAVAHRRWGLDRRFELGENTARIGTADQRFHLLVTINGDGCRLIVNGGAAEVGTKQTPPPPFRLLLDGGNNGADFGPVIIAGRPDSKWLQDVMKK